MSLERRSLSLLLVFLLALSAASAVAQERADDGGRVSKNGLTEGSVGGAEISVTYGRPKVNGREVWGALVPYGAVWRAGADEANTITFASAAEVEGQAVPAGTYAFFFLPEQDAWTFILNKVVKQWGSFRYDASQDQLRVEVQPKSADHAEELTYEIEGDALVLRWEKLAVPVKISG
jgi:hypothetical protein